jgi:hypothetical protein
MDEQNELYDVIIIGAGVSNKQSKINNQHETNKNRRD